MEEIKADARVCDIASSKHVTFGITSGTIDLTMIKSDGADHKKPGYLNFLAPNILVYAAKTGAAAIEKWIHFEKVMPDSRVLSITEPQGSILCR